MQQTILMDNVMVLLLASIIISVIMGWLTIKVAPKIGLMDIPGSAEHKNHKVYVIYSEFKNKHYRNWICWIS